MINTDTDIDIEQLLNKLNISLADIEGLSNEEAYRKIREEWIRLCLRYHPDKNPNDSSAEAKFRDINEAHAELREHFLNDNEYRHDIENFFRQEDVEIPETAFDLLLLENIEQAYADLLREYSKLQTNSDRAAFAAHYAPFLNLAKSLARKTHDLNSNRINHLEDKMHEDFLTSFMREWRQLIITLYAEEYLDDFQYRCAIAQGQVFNILATRKLLSPVKLIAAIIGSFNVLVNVAMERFKHGLNMLITFLLANARNNWNQGGARGVVAIFYILLAVTFLYVACAPLASLSPLALSLAFSTPAIFKLINMIANPVNALIRPLAEWTGASPIALSILFAAGAYYLLDLAIVMSVTTLLPYLCLASYLAQEFFAIQLALNVYPSNPIVAIYLGVATTLSTFLNLSDMISLVSSILSNTLIDQMNLADWLISSLCLFSQASAYYYLNQGLKDPNASMIETLEGLPLPKEPVPESIQAATLLGNKLATQSHRFFNTPAQAEYIEPKDRTFLQQASSFFGGGTVNNAKPQFQQPTPGVLCIA